MIWSAFAGMPSAGSTLELINVNEIYFVLSGVAVTPWKLVGYIGLLLFASRWLVQIISSSQKGRPTFPRLFWFLSLAGSSLLLCYFIFGKNDSIGIIANLFPMSVALYNLYLDIRRDRLNTPA
jgi:lipid-A-disaccharide synthase-like uncharacterized protein